MSDTKDKKGSTLKLNSKLTLGAGGGAGQGLRGISSGRNSRSVSVVVKKKKRMMGEEHPAEKTASDEVNPFKIEKETVVLPGGLTAEEREARLKALETASEEDKRKKEEELRKAELEEIEKSLSGNNKEEDSVDEEHDSVSEESNEEEVFDERLVDPNLVVPIKQGDKLIGTSSVATKEKDSKFSKKDAEKPARVHKEEPKRRSNKLTIADALSESEEKVRSLASIRRAREKARRAEHGDGQREKEKIVRDVIVPEVITVQELANRMAERVYDVTKSLMKMGMMVTANQSIDADTAELVIEEFGHKIKRVTEGDVEDIIRDDDDTEDDAAGFLIPRAPVVTFMGHVDHGKTSLLDAIRKKNVAEGEAGGITQHIGAYKIKTDSGHEITFLDTPGHEAFTAMRKRGANATDVVVLVVAADDGIMAQTVEAISHAKAAGVPIVVAINKVDKPGADPMKVRSSLLEHELVLEDFGGDVLSVEVSAKTGQNLEKLLDAIMLQSEVQELRANPERKAAGIVVEAQVDKGKGAISTLLVQKGTLKIGDLVIAGEVYGWVRAMMDDSGKKIDSAGPSTPVAVLGLGGAPEAGVKFSVIDSERQAREITEYRQRYAKDLKNVAEKKGTLEDLFKQAANGGKKELNVIIKGDVQGSVEAIVGSLNKVATDEVAVRILHSAVGGISESDVILAGASNALVLGFNVRADAGAREIISKDGVDVRYYSIIYALIDEMKGILSGMLSPEIREKFLGNAEIREVFNVSKKGKISGCFVTDGIIKRGAGVRLLRDNIVIYEGTLKTLKRFKDDVKEVKNNFECGMSFENYDDVKPGDIVEAFELTEIERTLD